jgi:hypothetical protein
MVQKIEKYFSAILIFLISLFVFKNWFNLDTINAGDFSSVSNLKELQLLPYAWGNNLSALGGSIFPYSWSYFVTNIPLLLLELLGIPLAIAQKIAFFYSFIIFSIFASSYIFKKLFPAKKIYFLSPIIFLFNTYILMLTGGGQIFVALACSISPLILICFISQTNKKSLGLSLISGLILSLQIMLDLRIAYVTLVAIVIYWLFKQIENKNIWKSINSSIYTFIIPGFISIFLNFFWILPTIIFHQNPIDQLGSAYSSAGAVQYFSFAKFENTISLLHPNWSENIFGKVEFMRPEFIFLPILAFCSLFFIRNETKDKKRYVLFFALLGLIGVFLAKGANDPFGGIYLWMFNHVPGFVMFRDPTKWYLLVVISYSILIPFTVCKIYEWLESQSKFQISNLKFKIKSKIQILNLQNAFLFFVIFYLLFLIRPAFLGQLNGTFNPKVIPNEYKALEKYLSSDNNFSRVLWVPTSQRFGFYSSSHPAIPAQSLFNLTDLQKIDKIIVNSQSLLQASAVKYVIVPYDSQGEIFLRDRKYDEKAYLQTVIDMGLIPWLKRVEGFGKIAIFENSNYKDHFWSADQNLRINYKYISPVEYSVEVNNSKKGDILVFSENFDENWIAENPKFQVHSSKFDNKFNSFVLPINGDYILKIYYTPQDYVNIGLAVSIISLVGLIIVFIVLVTRKNRN